MNTKGLTKSGIVDRVSWEERSLVGSTPMGTASFSRSRSRLAQVAVSLVCAAVFGFCPCTAFGQFLAQWMTNGVPAQWGGPGYVLSLQVPPGRTNLQVRALNVYDPPCGVGWPGAVDFGGVSRLLYQVGSPPIFGFDQSGILVILSTNTHLINGWQQPAWSMDNPPAGTYYFEIAPYWNTYCPWSYSVQATYSPEFSPSFLTNGPVSYYPFNGNVNDESENAINGTVVGATLTEDRFGRPASAYAFSGEGQYIVVTNSLHPQGEVTLTYSCWVVIQGTLPNSGAVRTILNVASQPCPTCMFTPNTRSDISIDAHTGIQLHYVGEGNDVLTPIAVPNSNTWHHVVLTKDHTHVAFYLDEVMMGTGNTQPGQNVTSQTLFVGNNGDPYHYSGEQFYGLIDDVRIYNRVLSASEVEQLYEYESQPVPTPRHPATATATLGSGSVSVATITDGGYGYTNTPSVRFLGGGGSGAQAVAVVSNGMVVAINIVASGHDYSSTPVIVIAPAFIERPSILLSALWQLNFTNLVPGTNYQLQSFTGISWSNIGSTFTATSSTSTQNVDAPLGPNGYRLARAPVPTQACASAQVINGFVVGASVTSGGSGYVTNPAVTIVGGGGANATAEANLASGAVTSITITDAEGGYTNTPAIHIAPPPVAAVSPAVLPIMRLDSANLAPYDNYQIQFKTNLGAAWGNWSGGLFSPTDVTNSQYLLITNAVGFVRLQYVP